MLRQEKLEFVPLDQIPPGAEARLVSLEVMGDMRRRLLDLGFVPGGTVHVLRRSGGNHLTALRVKETTICLRQEEAARIFVNTHIDMRRPSHEG